MPEGIDPGLENNRQDCQGARAMLTSSAQLQRPRQSSVQPASGMIPQSDQTGHTTVAQSGMPEGIDPGLEFQSSRTSRSQICANFSRIVTPSSAILSAACIRYHTAIGIHLACNCGAVRYAPGASTPTHAAYRAFRIWIPTPSTYNRGLDHRFCCSSSPDFPYPSEILAHGSRW